MPNDLYEFFILQKLQHFYFHKSLRNHQQLQIYQIYTHTSYTNHSQIFPPLIHFYSY